MEDELVILVSPARLRAFVKVRESELKLPLRLTAPFVTVRSAVVKLPVRLIAPLVLISVSLLKAAPAEKVRAPALVVSDHAVISGLPEKLVELPFVSVKESMLQFPLMPRLPLFLFSSMLE